MKKSALLFSGAALLILAASCDSKSRLSGEVQGVWGGTPESISDTGASQATLVRLMEFNRTGNSPEGTVTMTALITVENAMQPNDTTAAAPIAITASGTATITGAYQAIDDDEIVITLEASSLSVSVDPEGVKLSYNIPAQTAPDVEKIKAPAMMLASQQITRAAQNTFYTLTKLDDIKINNNLMSCEINDRDLTFRRQSAK